MTNNNNKKKKNDRVFTPNVILGSSPGNYIAGVNIDTPEVINSSGNWTNYAPEHETQNELYETYSCTCFSNNDAREALFTFLVQNGKIPAEHDQWLRDNGYYKNGKINFDDRVPAMYADITLGVGTYLWKAAEACRKWSLPQDILPKPRTIAEYYDKTLMTQQAINLQAEFDKRFKWIWFWNNSLGEGLTYSPVVGTVAFMNGNNILCPTTTHNHAVVALNMDKQQNFVVIDDSYVQQFKRYCLQGFADYLGWKLIIIQNDNNNMDKAKFLRENDTKQVRNKDTGAYGVIYGGQLLKITPERAGLYMIDREARGLIGKLPTIQVSDTDWNLLWRPSPEQEGRYF